MHLWRGTVRTRVETVETVEPGVDTDVKRHGNGGNRQTLRVSNSKFFIQAESTVTTVSMSLRIRFHNRVHGVHSFHTRAHTSIPQLHDTLRFD